MMISFLNLINKFSYLVLLFISQGYKYLIAVSPNISIKKNVKFKGIPIIQMHPQSKLYLGNNVTLNSYNRTYHLNMHSKVKILLDKPGAVIEIGDNTRIHGVCIHAWSKVSIGKNCLIAANTHIIDSNAHAASFDELENRLIAQDIPAPIYIDDNVWIGANVFILKGVSIGNGAVIGAGSIVNSNVPPKAIVSGNPATIKSIIE